MINKPDNIHIPDSFPFQHIKYRCPGFLSKIIFIFQDVAVVQDKNIGFMLDIDQHLVQGNVRTENGNIVLPDPLVNAGVFGIVLVTRRQLRIVEIELMCLAVNPL